MIDVEGSKYNSAPQVTKNLSFPDEVFIVDSTIRSLQSGVSGSRHTADDLVEIGKALDGLGVRELIVNLSWKDGIETCEGLCEAGLDCKLVGTFRARDPSWKALARRGIRAGADEICFESAPDAEYLREAAELVQSENGGVSHAFAEIYAYEDVVKLCQEAARYGYQSQSFHGSFFRFGIAPEAIKFFIASIREDVKPCPPLYVHLSNFFGHATMTAVAALAAGASAADVSMNVIGHHCGHIRLAEVAMVLEGLYGVSTGIKLERLREVSQLVQRLSGIPVSSDEPVVGDLAFRTDGAYWAAEADLPYGERVHARFPFPPYLVGSEEHVVWSEKTITRESVKSKLSTMRLEFDDQDVEAIIDQLTVAMAATDEFPMWLSDSRFETLCRRVVSESAPRSS